MPLSIWNGMEATLEVVVGRRPAAVLDAGIGFGAWGCLLRQYLDVWCGRIQPGEWAVRIDGVEIDERRVQAHARHLYDEVLVGDIREVVPARAAEVGYDVVLFGDVIEHLPKADGLALLDATVPLVSELVVVRIPFGDGWRREGREEPDHHRSRWEPSDFAGFPCSVRSFDFLGNPYGLVAIEAGGRRRVDRGRVLEAVDERLQRVERRLEGLVGP